MIRHELEYQISQSVCTEGSTKGILRRRAKRRRHSVEECEKGVDTTSARGRSSRGTTDDGEILNPITVGKERNSHSCQTLLERRDAPASIKGLCQSMKNPRLWRGYYYCNQKTSDCRVGCKKVKAIHRKSGAPFGKTRVRPENWE